MRKIFNLKTFINLLYIILIVGSFLLVPYYNIRTGFTDWGLTGITVKGPVNAAALAVQRALTFVLIVFYLYNLRLKRKIRDENIEVDMAIRETEERRHRVEREYFKLKSQMQNIFDAMDDFVFICSKDYRIEFMNKASKNNFGEGKSRMCYEVIYKRSQPCAWCFSEQALIEQTTTLEQKHEINGRIYRINISPFTNPDESISLIIIFHDITKEKEAEEKLGASEEYFRTVFEHLPAACFGYDRQANIVAWNAAATKLYGFPREDVLGRSMFETVAQKRDYEKTMMYINSVFQGKSFEGIEWQDRSAAGAVRYVYTNTYPMYDLEGNIIMGISANIDITARKAMEENLRESKEHLEKIMETPNSLIVELDNDLKIKTFNKGCEKSTGYARDEVLGKNWIELFIPDRLKDTIVAMFDEVKKESNILPSQFEYPIVTKSARERIIFWSNTNLKDEQGQIISIIAMGDDITQRKMTQQRIADAESKTRTFFENVPIHVGVIDSSGKFIIWNKYSEEMFGYTKQEVIDKMSPKDLHETEQEAKEVIEVATKQGIFDRELNLIHKNGNKIPVRLVVVPLKAKDESIGFCGFAEDISKRKSAENELLATKEKLESMALKDSLTELYNNRYVIERLNSEFARARRALSALSLLLIDLDYFKSINDKYGRAFGDKILVQTASLLKADLRANDIVARWAGEEFMVILSDVNRKNAIIVAKKIHRLLTTKGFGDEENVVNLACSIGVVSYPEDPLFSPKEMIEGVERSLLKVKGLGGNGVGSYIYGLITEEGKGAVSEKQRLIESLKEKMSFFAAKGEDSILEAIHSLTKNLELKDHTTRKHADKTVHYALILAQRLKMNEREIEDVRRAAILHDIGKLGIPDKILFKKGPLTKEEFKVIKQHPRIAAEIMSVADFLKSSIPYVLYHHERYDGTGYPEGLKAEEIPLGARIISVVDVYEALTSDRPYHKPMTKQEAIVEIQDNAGSQFDPAIVKEFIDLLKAESE